MALDAEERRGKLRKGTGICKQDLIRAFLNGATRQDEVLPPRVIVEPTRGTETSHYPEEKKEISISQVVASEKERAQTSLRTGVVGPCIRSYKNTI